MFDFLFSLLFDNANITLFFICQAKNKKIFILHIAENQHFIKKVKKFFIGAPKIPYFFHAKTSPAAKFSISGNIYYYLLLSYTFTLSSIYFHHLYIFTFILSYILLLSYYLYIHHLITILYVYYLICLLYFHFTFLRI